MDIDLSGLVLPERVEATRRSDDGRSGDFVIEPLERGYGHTLGNSVRRVLLSSLQGAAVWAFRIDGVVHEHQTIPGVVEDVHQVIQNLKALVVRLDEDVDEATLELKTSEAGDITAGMLEGRGGVDVLDADHHLLTLQEDRDFRMELRVNKGRGFVIAAEHPLEKGAPVDLVRVDSIYNPVRRANFQVSETRVGQRTDFDRLTLQLETDGSVSPEEALATAGELIRKHLEYLQYFRAGGIPEARTARGVAVPERLQELFAKDIEELAELSIRTRNALQKESIQTVGDLVRRSEKEMLDIENFGKKSLEEIQEVLGEHDLALGMQVEEDDEGRLFFVESAEGDAASTAAAGEGQSST